MEEENIYAEVLLQEVVEEEKDEICEEEGVYEDGDDGDDEAESEEKEVIEYHEPASMLKELDEAP